MKVMPAIVTYFFNRAKAITGFYLVLVMALSFAAIQVVKTSRNGVSQYNRISKNSILVTSMLEDIHRETADVQSATVRALFNSEQGDVEYELASIDSMQTAQAPVWMACKRWLDRNGVGDLYDSLVAHRAAYNQSREHMLQLTAGASKIAAIDYYYRRQTADYNHYHQVIQAVAHEIEEKISGDLHATNQQLTRGSNNVNLWLLISFLVMVAGGFLVTRHQKKLLRVQQLLVNERQERLAEIARQTIRAQEEERNELGAELHDNVNQILSAAKLYLSTVNQAPDKNEELIDASREYIGQAIEEIRCISKALVSPLTNHLALKDALRELARTAEIASPNIRYHLYLDAVDEKDIGRQQQLSLYRIAQEQLNNIAKHACATVVSLALQRQGDQLIFTVADNGRGFDSRAVRKGIGISNILHRAEAYRGTAAFHTAPGKGCRLTVSLPMNVSASAERHTPSRVKRVHAASSL
jgi:signal transduction histidine kinase